MSQENKNKKNILTQPMTMLQTAGKNNNKGNPQMFGKDSFHCALKSLAMRGWSLLNVV